MATIIPFTRHDVLGPDDLRVAADAFEAALQSLDGPLSPAAQEQLARYIVRQALHGERSLEVLRKGALAYLSHFKAAQWAS